METIQWSLLILYHNLFQMKWFQGMDCRRWTPQKWSSKQKKLKNSQRECLRKYQHPVPARVLAHFECSDGSHESWESTRSNRQIPKLSNHRGKWVAICVFFHCWRKSIAWVCQSNRRQLFQHFFSSRQYDLPPKKYAAHAGRDICQKLIWSAWEKHITKRPKTLGSWVNILRQAQTSGDDANGHYQIEINTRVRSLQITVKSSCSAR